MIPFLSCRDSLVKPRERAHDIADLRSGLTAQPFATAKNSTRSHVCRRVAPWSAAPYHGMRAVDGEVRARCRARAAQPDRRHGRSLGVRDGGESNRGRNYLVSASAAQKNGVGTSRSGKAGGRAVGCGPWLGGSPPCGAARDRAAQPCVIYCGRVPSFALSTRQEGRFHVHKGRSHCTIWTKPRDG